MRAPPLPQLRAIKERRAELARAAAAEAHGSARRAPRAPPKLAWDGDDDAEEPNLGGLLAELAASLTADLLRETTAAADGPRRAADRAAERERGPPARGGGSASGGGSWPLARREGGANRDPDDDEDDAGDE